jgi:PII-like signaling protein
MAARIREKAMRGISLRFFVPEGEKHDGELMYEWLLEKAKKLGIPGGSAFRAVAGYGRHGVLHEQTFFELAGELPVEVIFITSSELAEKLLAQLRSESLSLFYAKTEAEFGILGQN